MSRLVFFAVKHGPFAVAFLALAPWVGPVKGLVTAIVWTLITRYEVGWERSTNPSSPPGAAVTVEQALDVLRRAGWQIREDREIGQLVPNIDPPLVMIALGYDPANRHYARTVAQMPWTES